MNVDRWLLPEGVEEFLPAEALGVEALRRRLLDLYHCWGYEMIMPPLFEFTDSLLSGVGSDLDLITLKVTDQVSGRTMGLRADITPQAARIDAHSYVKAGVSRLCYADHVLHAKSKSPLGVRTPLQAGVEVFGEAGLDADIEVISLLLESLASISVPSVTLDLGHVGIFRALIEVAELSAEDEQAYLNLLQTKDIASIEEWVGHRLGGAAAGPWLSVLPCLCGSVSMLDKARSQLQGAPDEVFAAIDELDAIHGAIHQRYPDVNLYLDLGELRGYHYHTGIVFAAYADGIGSAIANGGRYDHIGEAFGRARPATGFAINLTSILPLLSLSSASKAIYAPDSSDPLQWQAIQQLRAQGERVICGLSNDSGCEQQNCDRQLVFNGSEYRIEPFQQTQ